MGYKKSINLIIFIFSIFIIHIILYYSVSSYNEFFKNLKYDKSGDLSDNKTQELGSTGETTLEGVSNYTGSKFSISDDGDTNETQDEKNSQETDTGTKNNVLIGDKIQQQDIENTGKIDNSNTTIRSSTSSLKVENEILNLFSDYDLQEKELTKNSTLFGLTNEYPYGYKEYDSADNTLTLYIFDEGKSYEDILNIFDVISYNMYFKVKKINNFGDYSFYINLNSDYDDGFIRFVFSYKNRIFGLKIKKDSYNDLKKLLQNIG